MGMTSTAEFANKIGDVILSFDGRHISIAAMVGVLQIAIIELSLAVHEASDEEDVTPGEEWRGDGDK